MEKVAEGRPDEAARPAQAECDRDDEPEAHHEEEHFHPGMVARLECGRELANYVG